MAKTLNKHIRVDEDHWERIEQAAKRRGNLAQPLDDRGHLANH